MGHNKTSCKNPRVVPEPQPKKMDRPRLEPNLLNWLGTKRGSRAGGRAGGGRSRGGGRGSSGRGNRGGCRGSGEGVQTEYGEGTSEFSKCEPQHVVIPNVVSEKDESPDFHMDISITIDKLRKYYYTREEIMDCLGLSKAELQQIEVEELPITQVLGDEEMMNEEDGIDELGMGEVMVNDELMDGEREIPITQKLNQVRRRPIKRSKVNQVRRRKPSERITEIKLQKVVAVKNGKGMSSSNPLSIE
ncbi:unnamed protein product [Lactuca saligna]|uniref:Uncharacterized protein n=1 Tax=Lactuca saligna TaxID=75948 RepID=A0AA35Z1V5_LACSI|nr:unnamed protein product [Lactuca saligna]